MLNSGTRTHREWRKVAKRERRRRLRTEEARARDSSTKMTSEEYQNWLKEQEELEAFEYEQIERINVLENKKWMEAEKIAIEHWNMLQEGKRLQLQEYLQQEAKLKMEWELEQKRRKEVEEKLKKIEEEKKIQQQLFMSKLEQFLSGDLTDPPPELLVSHETKPLMEVCPFFNKTACCRFGDQCSRNHRYPGISKVLLATNFYVHFGLSNANFSEYDTDVMLEYEDSDTQKEFVEFFNDVVPEFEKFGRIIQFKVCNNYEKHLRGNTYVEYAEVRSAVAAYQSLHSRWYGGRQLSLQFCLIDSWKNAVCGLASRRRCPKGRACNFLHVFKNPRYFYDDYKFENNRKNDNSSRSWRWSESPEKVIRYSKERSNTSERNRRSKIKTSTHERRKSSRSKRR
ncbi:hypothetical protein evm_012620 [Chilo suppressalis]|nr:hypothetical protein evm_012620 [Chilo suppressalis]